MRLMGLRWIRSIVILIFMIRYLKAAEVVRTRLESHFNTLAMTFILSKWLRVACKTLDPSLPETLQALLVSPLSESDLNPF